jgi:small subunit ribosomal protein S9
MSKEETKTEKYFEGVGRRKTASARVRIYPDSKDKEVLINGQDYRRYFKDEQQRQEAVLPLRTVGLEGIKATVNLAGGGLRAQAGAVSLGFARAILKSDESLRTSLSQAGLLTRDPRMVERKKYGLKKARRASQWAKR